MTTRRKIYRTFGIILFSFGILLGMGLIAITVWTDLEASFFDSALASQGGESLKGLRCPVLVTSSEIGTITATVKNPADKPVELRLRAHITDGFVTLMREVNATLQLEPGEKKTAEFFVTTDDATYHWLVLVRVRQFRYSPLPTRQASCGVLARDVLGLIGGMALWSAGNWPLNRRSQATVRTMAALTVSLVVGFIVGFTGSWLLGTLLFAINLLLIFEIVRHAVQKSGDLTSVG
jgi:hypothetical protein